MSSPDAGTSETSRLERTSAPRGSGIRELSGWGLVLLLVAFGVFLVGRAYQSVESWIPYWDFARIEGLFHGIVLAFDEGIVEGIRWTYGQVNSEEYNSLFGLPLLVMGEALDSSRDRLILALLTGYSFLYACSFAVLVRTTVGSLVDQSKLIVLAPVLLPPLLTATLLGFETIAVLPFLTLAVAVLQVSLWPVSGARRGNRAMGLVMAGVLLAACFLLRRAYVLAIVATLGSAGLVITLPLIFQPRTSLVLREFLDRLTGLLLCGLAAGVTLMALGPGRVESLFAVGYKDLYAAWNTPAAEVLSQLTASVGLVPLILAGGGLAIGIATARRDLRPRLVFVALLLVSTLVGWITLVGFRMRFDKPLLLAPALSLGWALLLTKWRVGGVWRMVALAVVGVLGLNLAIALGAVGQPSVLSVDLFATAYPPNHRGDLPELERMNRWLHRPANRGPVYVLAATGDFNDSLVKQADLAFNGRSGSVLNLPPFNSVDRTTNYPVWMHDARVILVAVPFQQHSSSKERRLLRFAWEEFSSSGPYSAAFTRVGAEWRVGRRANRPVRVEAFRRHRASSLAETLDLIERARAFAIHQPVYSDLWLFESRRGRSQRLRESGNRYRLEAVVSKDKPSSAIYMERIAGLARLTVSMPSAPRGLEVRVFSVDAEEPVLRLEEFLLEGAGIQRTVEFQGTDPQPILVGLEVRTLRSNARQRVDFEVDLETN
ncbi:MAG: hypothetical protein K8J08_03760 [Thermoanaerobaculia bacterium]|nr:hypothetical protein [Thermoanaerobaculia bacterium]